MNCPRCESTMKEIDRDGITIDRCDRCRGVFLDRGELEKLIALGQGNDERDRGRNQRDDRNDDDDDDDRRGGGKRSWWDIFD